MKNWAVNVLRERKKEFIWLTIYKFVLVKPINDALHCEMKRRGRTSEMILWLDEWNDDVHLLSSDAASGSSLILDLQSNDKLPKLIFSDLTL